ncbi:MAG: 2-oxoglutarate and iron-dependent oxygenase domain-containing protein [Rhabdochlamydiaceae bacterium]|nr:2-oxoglutarate and iron-dependent oxygenase domain-containing protein [Candidatus Amphrikana amoebophyrae]
MKRFIIPVLMLITTSLRAFDATIPVLHLPDYLNEDKKEAFLEKLESAMHEVGFFALTGTGVDPDILDNGYEAIKEFFALDLDYKMSMRSASGQRGYVLSESAKGENVMDLKEFCHIGHELSDADLKRLGYVKNIWPQHPQGYKESMLAMYNGLEKCRATLCNAFSEVLKQPLEFLDEMTVEGDSLMRTIHYPANGPKSSIWAGAHTDINLFTILPRSTAKGLQVLNKEGQWIDVLTPDGAFVINCGDFLENLTNGYARSSFHRVIDPGLGQERFSTVFFVHTRSSDRLDPLPQWIEKTGGKRLRANATRLELLAERLIDLRLASQELKQFFVDSGAIERLKEVNRFSLKAEAELRKSGFDI